MPRCNFCGKMYDLPRGITVVTKKGELLHFCSSKCRKNHKLGRIPRKVKWIKKKKKARKNKGKSE